MRSSRSPKVMVVLLAMQMIVSLGAGLRAEEKIAPNAPVVWRLDNPVSIGGHNPEVLGAPQVVDDPVVGRTLHFNGQSDGLILPVNPIAGWARFTIEAIFLPDTNGPSAPRFVYIVDEHGSRATLETRSTDGKSWCLDTYLQGGKDYCTLRDTTKQHPTGQWAWAALVYDGKTMAHYVNGVRELREEVGCEPMTNGTTSLGVRIDRLFWFKGCIKEVRFHPTALAPEALQRVTEKPPAAR